MSIVRNERLDSRGYEDVEGVRDDLEVLPSIQHHGQPRFDNYKEESKRTNNAPRNINEFFKFGSILSFFAIGVDKGFEAILSNPLIKFLVAPLTIVTSLFSVGFKIREAAIRRNKHSKLAVLVEILSAGAMIAAAIGVIAAAAAFAFVAPILITAAIGLKTLFDFGSAIYYAATGDKDRAIAHLGSAAIGAVMTGLALTLMLVGGPVVQAAVGITGLVVSATAMAVILFRGIYNTLKCCRKNSRVSSMDRDDFGQKSVNDFGSAKKVARAIGASKNTQAEFVAAEELASKPVVVEQDRNFVDEELAPRTGMRI